MIACLFDIDGTLLASGGAGKAALESAFTDVFGVPLKVQVPYAGRTDRAISRDLLSLHGIEPSLENWEKLRNAYLARLPDSLNKHNGRVLPGITALLAILRTRKDIALGLLTGNVRAGAQTKLGHFGLFEHFTFGGFGDLHFDRDDVAREAFAAVKQHVGTHVKPECIWVIGDTPLDIRCARAIGVNVLAVATGQHSVDDLGAASPDLLLRDLSDPAAFLNLLA